MSFVIWNDIGEKIFEGKARRIFFLFWKEKLLKQSLFLCIYEAKSISLYFLKKNFLVFLKEKFFVLLKEKFFVFLKRRLPCISEGKAS